MTKHSPTIKAVLTLHDAKQPVADIALHLSLSAGYVYGVLREHRPNRARKPRRTTSDLPRMIAGLAKQGIKPGRIAVALAVSLAYVYRHLEGGK